jgi:hypothetical protein
LDDKKIDKTAVKQVVGTSETDVMSQKAVTDNIFYTLADVGITPINDILISSVNGEIIETTSGSRGYIIGLENRIITKLKFSTTTYGGNYGYGFILSDNTWSGVHTTSNTIVNIDVPIGAKEFRMCWNASNIPSNTMYVSGSKASIESVLNTSQTTGTSISKTMSQSSITKLFADVITSSQNISNLFNIVESSVNGRFAYETVGVLDYYGAFDELTFTFPDFNKETKIGDSNAPLIGKEDQNIYPINRYTYQKTGATPTKKAILCGAIHGDSEGWTNTGGDAAQNILSQYYFILDLLMNPEKNDRYKFITDTYIIDVVPILNPWGVQNHSRYNGRDVDLNRNYGVRWIESSDLHKGASAFSESESAAFRDYVVAQKLLITIDFVCEVHARGQILLTLDNRWHWVGPASSDALVATIHPRLTEKYGGMASRATYTITDCNPSLTPYIEYIQGVKAWEPELFQSVGNDAKTRNTKLTNIQATDYLIEMFIGYLESI